MKKLTAALFLIAVLALPGRAEFLQLDISIFGMDCMTCAYAVRVALMKYPGVESAEVSLNKGLATVKLKPGNAIRPSEFWEAIRKNGNTPKATHVIVRGEVQPGGTQLKVTGSNEVLELKAAPTLQQQLKAATGKIVNIEGTLTPGKDVKAAVPLEVQGVRP